MEGTNKFIVLTSIMWTMMERSGNQIVQFIILVILARLLLPEDYGVIALVVIFINIADIFVQSGLNTALIQKKDADQIDFSTSFYFSFIISGTLYCMLFILAPNISKFFDIQSIDLVIRVLAISLFFAPIISIEKAYASRNMMFKKFFISTLGATVISGISGITIAYLGLGVWALVSQQLIYQILNALILWSVIKWRPNLTFSFMRIKQLFSFGWKILVSGLIDTLERDLRSLIIGRMYTPEMLGFYSRGQTFPMLIVGNINNSIQSVMLPVLSQQQDNLLRMKELVRRSIITSSFLMTPMMFGMAIIAEPLVRIVLTDAWLPTVPFLQISCATFVLLPIHTANLQAITAMGRSGLYLKMEIIKKIIGLSILAISIPFGIYAMAWGMLISGVIASFINSYPNRKLLKYGYREQIKDIYPTIILSLIMSIIVYSVYWLDFPDGITLFIQIIVGFTVYFGMAKISNLECFNYLSNTVSGILRKGR
jgi:O-antigen/teichoic acid export membrane protein